MHVRACVLASVQACTAGGGECESAECCPRAPYHVIGLIVYYTNRHGTRLVSSDGLFRLLQPTDPAEPGDREPRQCRLERVDIQMHTMTQRNNEMAAQVYTARSPSTHSASCPLGNVRSVRSHRVVRSRQVALESAYRLVFSAKTHLVEHPQLVRGERANHRVEQTPIVEQDQISLIPILRVDHLLISRRPATCDVSTHFRSDTGALNLVQELSDLLEIGDNAAIRVQLAILALSLRQRVNVELVRATWVHLDVQLARLWVLPALRMSLSLAIDNAQLTTG